MNKIKNPEKIREEIEELIYHLTCIIGVIGIVVLCIFILAGDAFFITIISLMTIAILIILAIFMYVLRKRLSKYMVYKKTKDFH